MPDPAINPLNPPQADAAARNAEIAAKLAAQDAAGHSTAGKPGDFEDATSALDKLAAAVPEKKPDAPIVEPAAKTPEELAAEKQAAEEAAAKKAADDAAAAAKAAATPDPLKDVAELPETASPKSRDHWNALKAKAAQEIAAREQQIADYKKKLSEIEERSKNPTPEQIQREKELEELRIFRAKLDVQFDPQFKKFDTQLSQNEEFIYAQLRKSPSVSEAVIEEIKKYGGPDKCNLTKVFETLGDPTLQRIVESKIAENAHLRYQKEQALTSTKSNMEQYLKEREKSYLEAVTAHTTATQSELNRMLGALEWAKPRPVEGDDNAKKAAEAYNAEVATVTQQVKDALNDDSPQMRAILLTSYANMCHLQTEGKALKAELESTKKALAEVTEKFERVKKSSTSRLREGAAPPGGALPQPKPQNQFNTTAGEAVDALARQVMEERSAKGLK